MGKVYLFIGAVVMVLVASTALLFVTKKDKTATNKTTTQNRQEQQAQKQAQTTGTTGSINSKTGDIELNISEPQDKSVSQVSIINVKGTTAPNAEVYVNDKQTKADAKGAFTVSIALEEGDNYVLVAAADQDGGYSEKELTVSYQSSQ